MTMERDGNRIAMAEGVVSQIRIPHTEGVNRDGTSQFDPGVGAKFGQASARKTLENTGK